jgi:predicted  nucleic acid-binding Zn-ribbon protein
MSNFAVWAAVIVVISAICFVVASVWLLFRIDRHADDASLAQERAAAEVRVHLAHLRETESGLKRLLADAAAELAKLRSQTGLSNAAQLEAIAAAVTRLEDAVVLGAGTAAPAPPSGPSPETTAEMQRLAMQRGRLEGEVDELRARLHDASRQLTDARRENRTAATAASTAEVLRQTNERLMHELMESRRQERGIQAQLGPLTMELQTLRAQLTAAGGGADLQASMEAAAEKVAEAYKHRLGELEAEVASLHGKSMKLQDELNRTLREKSFIEDRFLEATETA